MTYHLVNRFGNEMEEEIMLGGTVRILAIIVMIYYVC